MSNVVRSKFAIPFVLASLAMSSQLALASECAAPQREQGEHLFARDCAACHTAQKDGPTLMGPNLHGVIGRTPGTLQGVTYSQAMKSQKAAWTAQGVAAFIEQPQAAVPGTYMPYAGMADAGERQAVTCFLAGIK
ncbi:c-type cytochrome [Pseudomonas sp. BJa5]|uniref:c-type cytochrome n=1 Tax=Pseudomonas sp. BJa5 TaxID=2936270 RepID=UPI002559FE98|nr:c-type cytochrome [Pseudomonas sp. BGr12]MDL2421008.1 c-type cytochrome [Pseudomonas sp. BGr12]